MDRPRSVFGRVLEAVLGGFLLLRWLDLIGNVPRRPLLILLSQWQIWVTLGAVFGLLGLARRRMQEWQGVPGALAAVFISVLALMLWVEAAQPLRTSLALVVLFILNTLSEGFMSRLVSTRTRRLVSGALLLPAYPVAELMCPVVLARVASALIPSPLLQRISPWVARCIALALLIPAHATVATYATVGTIQRAESRQISAGEYYGLKIDAARRWLFASNIRDSRIDRFDLDDPFRKTGIRSFTGEAGAHPAYDPIREELVTYRRETGVLSFIDARSLETVSQARVGSPVLDADTTPGLPVLAVDPVTRHVFIAFEEGEFWVYLPEDQQRILAIPGLGDRCSSLAMDVIGGRLFINYFVHKAFVGGFSLDGNVPAARLPLRESCNQSVVDSVRRLLFVAQPRRGQVLAFGLDDLKLKKKFSTVFLVRSIGVDEERGILFSVGLTNSSLRALDIESGDEIGRWRIGLWPRFLVVDPIGCQVFVSTKREGLWRVDYGSVAIGRLERPVHTPVDQYGFVCPG
ncbi:hypothetical protein JW905_16460 [bacterium]|nr:hypothetical protein [candidate division CSSED10-310 bacterium]